MKLEKVGHKIFLKLIAEILWRGLRHKRQRRSWKGKATIKSTVFICNVIPLTGKIEYKDLEYSLISNLLCHIFTFYHAQLQIQII